MMCGCCGQWIQHSASLNTTNNDWMRMYGDMHGDLFPRDTWHMTRIQTWNTGWWACSSPLRKEKQKTADQLAIFFSEMIFSFRKTFLSSTMLRSSSESGLGGCKHERGTPASATRRSWLGEGKGTNKFWDTCVRINMIMYHPCDNKCTTNVQQQTQTTAHDVICHKHTHTKCNVAKSKRYCKI